jgi:hypothetical protein
MRLVLLGGKPAFRVVHGFHVEFSFRSIPCPPLSPGNKLEWSAANVSIAGRPTFRVSARSICTSRLASRSPPEAMPIPQRIGLAGPSSSPFDGSAFSRLQQPIRQQRGQTLTSTACQNRMPININAIALKRFAEHPPLVVNDASIALCSNRQGFPSAR